MNRATLHRTQRLAAAAACCLVLTVACDSEPPPHTVVDFLDNPRLLEATMVRCAANRAELKYTPECLAAREAVDRLAAAEEADRRKELEAQSARKREALRRAQEAAAAARARAAEAERLRREAEYLSQFEELPPAGSGDAVDDPAASPAPMNAAPTASGETSGATSAADEPPPSGVQTFPQEPVALPPATDLDSVRDELRRRAQSEDPQQPDNQ